MFDGREPIYLQIADRIRAEVLDGSLQEGDQVKSTTQYATTYRINPATAAKAFAELVDEGVLHKRRGIGMFVSDGARDQLLAARRERFFAEVVDPVATEAQVLGIPIAQVVARLHEVEAARAAAHGEERS
ncbi:GntR family transcriptional regulator [Cellulomonas sp. APG4]|uniref:GntR family transcriptional regulator n=1 Tax=Cellulomonas sp. APG4 TaxID=1538656 RepID=UPI00137B5690|nr:GntR family transcriptional regulator [Cellulomonas sp. APG4]